MVGPGATIRSVVWALVRGAIGFVVGFIVACFVLVVAGVMPPDPDQNALGIEQQVRSLWLAFYLACGVAVLAMIVGRVGLVRY